MTYTPPGLALIAESTLLKQGAEGVSSYVLSLG